MKTKILAIMMLLIFAGQAVANSVGITSVSITPSNPLDTDSITFNISGWASKAAAFVVYDEFLQNGTSLQLDLYVDMGIVDIVSPWADSKQIQPLLADNYNLEVRAFRYNSIFPPSLQDTYVTSFGVTPEPGTIALLCLGLPFLKTISTWR